MRPRFGIVRIDYSGNHCWAVRLTVSYKKVEVKTFTDLMHGGKAKALRAAKKYRDSLIKKRAKIKGERLSTIKPNVNHGANYLVKWVIDTKGIYEYLTCGVQASIYNKRTGKTKYKYFSVNKYGLKNAIEWAIQTRLDWEKSYYGKTYSDSAALKKRVMKQYREKSKQ